MKKFKLLPFIATLVVTLFVGMSTASAAKSPSLAVNMMYANSKTVTGTATKGVDVLVKNSSKKTIAKSKASKNTGKYTVKLKTAMKANQRYYIYAQRSSVSYFYRIMTVQPAKKTSGNNKPSSTTNKNNSGSKTTNVAPSTPTGTWKSGKDKNGNQLVMKFSQSIGFNEYLYNGKKLKKTVVSYAAYSVKPAKNNFWAITYRTRGSKKTQTFYVRFSSNKRFDLVNSKNKIAKFKIAGLAANTYRFDLTK